MHRMFWSPSCQKKKGKTVRIYLLSLYTGTDDSPLRLGPVCTLFRFG